MLRSWVPLLAVAVCVVLAASVPAYAQFGWIGDKLKEKAQEKTEEAIDEAVDGEESTEEAGEAEGEEPAGDAPKATGETAAAEDMALYTKYDFIPGDRVIFYDDLSTEEMGEFPSRWRLDNGVFEIANQGGRNWIWCSDQGLIRPRIAVGPLPPKYTIEADFYSKGPDSRGHYYYIKWFDGEDNVIGELGMTDIQSTRLVINHEIVASKDLAKPLARGVHTIRVMATQTTLKCYIDSERVANVPAVEGYVPVDFGVYMDPWLDEEGNPMLLGTFRYAEGGKTLREQLNEAGRIVSHGILFDTASAKIKAESYKTLADMAKLLTDDPALKLSIEGHTDSDGSDESNVTLSQNRADAVRTYFMDVYKIDGARLTTKGWGEGKPIDVNTTPEGKANNRRVEFVKV